LAVVLGIVAVGAVDAATGIDVRVVSLYFLPLAMAGWRLGRRGAVLASLLAATVWMAAQYFGGPQQWSAWIWGANLVTQTAAFVTVGILVALLAERLEAEASLGRRDVLTGLPNRRALFEEAAIVLPLCRRHDNAVSLAFLDLDNFKQVNDRLGHERGDEVLRAFATVLASTPRASDVAARLGGDEFVLLMPHTRRDEALALVDRIRSRFAADARVAQTGVTVSVGLLTEDPASSTIEELLRHTDAALSDGKLGGKDRVTIAEAARLPTSAPGAD
jgi:diguanylate cyclase (GGDEF)-like protein